MPEPLNASEFERLAEGKVEPGPWGYFAGGAGDERTLADNVAAFGRWRLRPRMLVDVGSVTTETSVLGRDVSMPVLVAPTAFQQLAHPDGDLAVARGTAAAGTVMCLSTLGGASPAELAEAAPGARHWFQLYWSRDREFTQALVEAAAEAGFEAIVLTIDLPAAGRRERDLRAAFEIPEDLPLPNLARHLGGGDFHATLGQVVDPTITWLDLEWLRSVSNLPLIVKGILDVDDARAVVDAGADAVVVSNHGGRQLDRSPTPLEQLPAIVGAVGDRAEVYLDGGILDGADIVAAVAFGARACLVGRAYLYGLMAGGERGVRRVVDILSREVTRTMQLLGVASVAELTPERVHLRS